MERKTYLNRYRVSIDRLGLPFIIRRSADEAMFQASDPQSGDQVAVQVMPASAFGTAERDQLAAEARAAQEINHPNIPRLRDFGFDNDQLVYVTDYLEGRTAEDWVREKGPMPASVVLQIGAQVMSALVAAGLHGIVHYAVYPGNIVLAPGESAAGEWPQIKLVNLLGMVPSVSLPGQPAASLNPVDFASPEQLENRPLNFRSEIYSLGCTLWFLLKGAPLLGGAEALPGANGLSEPLRQLLTGMLAKNPAERPSDPLAIQQQIQNCLAQIERQDEGASLRVLPAPVQMRTEIKTLPSRRSAWSPLALAAILIALAALVAMILKQRAPELFAGSATAMTAPTAVILPAVSVAPVEETPAMEEPAKLTAPTFDLRMAEAKPFSPAPVAAAVAAPRVLPKEKDVEPVLAWNNPVPPAEGPSENAPPSVEILPPPIETPPEEKEAGSSAIASKPSPSPRVSAKPRAKKSAPSTASSPRKQAAPTEPPRRSNVIQVGHIFPEVR